MISVKIKSAGEALFTDRTNQLADLSLTLGTTKEAATGSLSVNYLPGKFKPMGEDEVQVYDGVERIFAGYIVRCSQSLGVGGRVVFDCDLKDKIHRLDRKLVDKTYESMRADEIVIDVVTRVVGSEITFENVEIDAGAVVSEITFNNVYPSEAISKIAELFGKEWFIDANSDLHFFSKLSTNAPWDVTETNGKIESQSLTLQKDFTQIRNSILVTGGEEKSTAETSDTFNGDGQTSTFTLSKKYTGITVTLNGTPITVGTANIDTFDDKDCLYDFSLRSLSFNTATPPASGVAITVTGRYYIPIAVRFRESTSISLFGEREFYINDSNIKSRKDAISRASAEITAYGNQLNEGSFVTHESGLRAGQKLHMTMPTLDLNEDFVIQRLSGRYTDGRMEWNVQLVSVKTFELIDLLAEIVRNKTQSVDTSANVSTAERLNRKLRIGREMRTYLNSPPTWVTGPFAPSNIDDRRRVMYCDRGARVT